MNPQFDRSAMLIGYDGLELLKKRHVAVFGLGGVGSFCAESLARAGIGRLTLVDFDVIDITNLNRQLLALHSTIGQGKAEVMRARLADINPEAEIAAVKMFYGGESCGSLELAPFDYIVDAIDTVTAKLLLIERAKEAGVPIISCMGTGNKLDPSLLEATDLSLTAGCPLARIMRKELRKRGITSLKVVYSKEPPVKPLFEAKNAAPGRHSPGSLPFVPPAAGLLMAFEVVKELLEYR